MSTVTIYNSSINFSLSATGIPKSPRNRYLYHLDDDVNYSKCAFTFPAHGSAQPKLKTETRWVCFWFCRPDRQFRSFSCSNHPSINDPPRLAPWSHTHIMAVFYSRRGSIFHFLHVKATAPTYFRGAQFLCLQP